MRKLDFNDNKNIVHAGVKAARLRAKISQRMLAARLQALGVNIDQQAVSKIERNARLVTYYELACLCAALDILPHELLCLKDIT